MRTVEVEFEEGDMLKFNDKWWTVDEIDWTGSICLHNEASGYRYYDTDEIEHLIQVSGSFQRVKEQYASIVRS